MRGGVSRCCRHDPRESRVNEQVETAQRVAEDEKAEEKRPREKIQWETPLMEDVSEQVMAQPYIRFT